jgi:hypothetical protein
MMILYIFGIVVQIMQHMYTTNSIPAEIGSPVIFVRASFFLLEAS